MKVIDLVLQDPRIPSARFNAVELALFVQAFDAHAPRSRHDRRKTIEAQAAFEKLYFSAGGFDNLRIDDHVKWNGAPLALGKLFRRNILEPIFAVFDHRKLQGQADL